MEFLAVSMLVDAFHYASKIESKHKGKSCFATNPIRRTSYKMSLADSDKSGNPSHPTPPNQDHGKNALRKTRGNVANNSLPRNDVINIVCHGMIHLNARLRKFFWKNCLPLTYPTKT